MLQLVLNILVANHTPEDLFCLPSMKGAIAGLLVYNERHMLRYFSLKIAVICVKGMTSIGMHCVG
jgi:hypothetical protein